MIIDFSIENFIQINIITDIILFTYESYNMKFKTLYPENDKSDLTIKKLGDNSVSFSFEVLPEYIWRIGITLATTIWWFHSWWETVNPKIKKYFCEIAKITDENNDIAYKDSDNILKIMKSEGSDDITISNWFTRPQQLSKNVEITVNRDNCSPEIIDKLFSILSLDKNLNDNYGKY